MGEEPEDDRGDCKCEGDDVKDKRVGEVFGDRLWDIEAGYSEECIGICDTDTSVQPWKGLMREQRL